MTLEQSGLLPHHATLITESAITREVASARGYRSVVSKAELRGLGFSASQSRVPALLVPIWNVSGELASYQIRPDFPRIRDGKPLKYETPAGTHMVLDVPPVVRDRLGRPDIPLFITEGARKADAAATIGLCCIALLGVWNFRGTNAEGGKVALPDWESIALNGRRTYIVFDSDVMLKPQVHAALVRLKAFLESRRAEVLVIYLPSGDGGTKQGLDDFLARGNTVDALLGLASAELRAAANDDSEPPRPLYEATTTGIVWLKPTREGIVRTPLTNFTAKIAADVRYNDGVEIKRVLEIDAHVNGRTARFDVPWSQFRGMDWATEHLGADAIVYAGLGVRDHASVAVQQLSGTPAVRTVYTHLGWISDNDRDLYLHAGGAIGADGPVPDVTVHTAEPLARFVLPSPPRGDDLIQAIRASLRFLGLAPDRVTFPLLAAVARSVLGPADFSLHLAGPTGAGKTVLAALAQQHFGPEMNERRLPASWSSTGNALEGLTFCAKDALVVVDDFAPTGAIWDIQRYHREADRLFRAQGNNAGRQRMRADASLKPAKPPRGLILSTGEDVPRGHSLRARLLAIDVAPSDLVWTRVTDCQQDAANSRYAQALAGFIRWLASGYEAFRRRLHAEVQKRRESASFSDNHRRTPTIVADLSVGLDFYLEFAHAIGAITHEAAQELKARGWRALGELASEQALHQRVSEPAGLFLELLGGAVVSGRAHVAGPDGQAPNKPETWGWRLVTVGSGEHERTEWRPGGDRVGWVEADDLYLDPRASFAAVQRFGRDAGEQVPITLQTVTRRMWERHLLVSREEIRETFSIRRTLEGKRRDVLHLRASVLTADEPDQPDQPDRESEPPGLGKGAEDKAASAGASSAPPQNGDGPTRSPDGMVGLVGPGNGGRALNADAKPRTQAGGPSCRSCGGAELWQSRAGLTLCRECHPPAPGAEA
jgi:uncharacterized protein DUF3854/uncharacterized protein DUF927